MNETNPSNEELETDRRTRLLRSLASSAQPWRYA
mgnify:CR=1 FL=1